MKSPLFLSIGGSFGALLADMEFVQKFTPLDFKVKNFTPSISPYFNSFRKKKHKKMSGNGEIYTAGKKFYIAAGSDGRDRCHLCMLMMNISLLSPLFSVFSLTNMVPSGQWPHSGIAVFPWWEKLSPAMLHHLFSALEESPNTTRHHNIVLFLVIS